MIRIHHRLDTLEQLPSLFKDIRHHLQFHTESGFSTEEAEGYAQQLEEVEAILLPLWKARLGEKPYAVQVDGALGLHGFIRIQILREGKEAVPVFSESYGHFNAEMCDGSFYQFVYQRVLCYQDGLESGRVDL